MHLDPLALSVCRLGKYPELLRLEKEADRVNTLALRVLYGFLTYMDDLVPSSPAEMYSNFLESMDAAVRKRLKLEDVYDVTVAKDGQEALDRVKESMQAGDPYNLIFMDVQMPNMDGLDSTRLIRQSGFSAPIVALTAYAEEVCIHIIRTQGAQSNIILV